eukprot:NODE_1707_length_1434_cov_30.072924_g1541_i0.p1 GENE.NODE_1707_length_1434_cov_30.072924_g1541_i0~~NODE_1707_length_1434_cov_30.072924_g1541_i0.p1  ORF type:complete len:406 (-),score=52.06 NODE_1707_length_1434_cov_30.072924_g1541_i0:141-1358(-)
MAGKLPIVILAVALVAAAVCYTLRAYLSIGTSQTSLLLEEDELKTAQRVSVPSTLWDSTSFGRRSKPRMVYNWMRRLALDRDLTPSSAMGTLFEHIKTPTSLPVTAGVAGVRGLASSSQGSASNLVVDVGLDNGMETAMAMLYGMRVISFEPNPWSCQVVSSNLKNLTDCCQALLKNGHLVDWRSRRALAKVAGSNIREQVPLPPTCIYGIPRDLSLILIGKQLESSGNCSFIPPEVHCMALSNASGTAQLFVNRPGAPQSSSNLYQKVNSETANNAAQAVRTPVSRLDDYVKEPVLLLKIDTQGNELKVLLGAKELLTRHGVQHLMLEFAPTLMVRAGSDPVALLEMLSDWGYTCCDLSWYYKSSLGRQSANRNIASMPFEAFVESLVKTSAWTDLLCDRMLES